MYSVAEKSEIIKRLNHVLDFCNKIQTFTNDLDYEDYVQDEVLYLALEKLFQNIGEALNQTPSKFQENNPEIEWREIVGMRNIIAHNYDDIDEDIMWLAIQNKIPALKSQMRKILDDVNAQ